MSIQLSWKSNIFIGYRTSRATYRVIYRAAWLRKSLLVIIILFVISYSNACVLAMSENTELILRPKVKFSRFSNQERNDEIIEESCKDNTNPQINGPKIKSIISLKKPVKIIDFMGSADVYEKDLLSKDCEIKSSSCSSDTASVNTQGISLSNDNVKTEIEISRILYNASSSQNKKEKVTQLNKNICTQNNTLKHCRKILQQKDKENKDAVLNKIIPNKNINKIRTRNSQYIQPAVCKKFKLFTNNDDVQKPDTVNSYRTVMTKLQSAPSIMKKTEKQTTRILNAKPSVMPCYRYIETGIIRNKVSPVKKIALRSTTGIKIKTSVEPGVSHKQQNNTKTDDANKKYCTISDLAVGKLAQPEYNSIMCNIHKLKEIKQREIVSDVNYFPHKNLLNEKISTALDFSLDETIFKNLVDLSIDDKQIPAIVRSKDPELRQKDITPKLSDFFVPEHTKDICTLIHVKFRAPKMNENWDIFKISNKILDWRHSLDIVR
ncbi:PREDICTED: uncharacterized protein LOC106748596 [Dinoponera quadriceps]|uniref:Uncharacterized protein LOC106748596 n=1 Tax=Dinoponera quadriceps TaxID=609295 RepID=A0A6P3XXW9_DINQU|nr:PREDICTED: uncharacterized protein LOC106748596 [Dinoponera quadriceps]